MQRLNVIFDSDSIIYKPKLIINNSVFYQNCGEVGGAIEIFQYETFINNSTFIENIGFSFGGAISIFSNVITIKNSLFIRNMASYGGAIYVNRQPFPRTDEKRIFTAESNIFYNNLAASSGGAIYTIQTLFDFTIIFSNCYFFKNTALIGGAMCFMNKLHGNTSFLNSTFFNNLADYGGGIYTQSNSIYYFSNCKFLANAAIKVFLKLADIFLYFYGFITTQILKIWTFSNFTTELIIQDGACPVLPGLDTLNLNDVPPEYQNTSAVGGMILLDVYFDRTITYSIQNLFKRNLALEKGGVGLIVSSNFSDKDSKYLENYSWNEGGVFDAEDKSNFFFDGSNFQRNSAKNLYYFNIFQIKIYFLVVA